MKRFRDNYFVDALSLPPVLSSQIEFDPKGSQSESFADNPPRAAVGGILLAKMRGNQVTVIPGKRLRVFSAERLLLSRKSSPNYIATRESGKSTPSGRQSVRSPPSLLRTDFMLTYFPPATASYRLLPSISILDDIPLALLPKFQACFPAGVIEIFSGKAVVANARADTVSREVLRHPEFEGKVELGRVRDHFICEQARGRSRYRIAVDSVTPLQFPLNLLASTRRRNWSPSRSRCCWARFEK